MSDDLGKRIDAMIERHSIPKGPGPKRRVVDIRNVCNAIEDAWMAHPEYRLGQLLSNAMGAGPQDLFYVEDDVLVAALSAKGVES